MLEHGLEKEDRNSDRDIVIGAKGTKREETQNRFEIYINYFVLVCLSLYEYVCRTERKEKSDQDKIEKSK